MAEAGDKLAIIKFTATWCPPCKAISPAYHALAKSTPQAAFAECDVDGNAATAQKYGITAMPTFKGLKNGKEVAEVKGANPSALQKLVAQYAGPSTATASTSGSSSSSIHGSSLLSYIDKLNSSCLNEAQSHRLKDLFSGGYLESDADEQLLLSLPVGSSTYHGVVIEAVLDATNHQNSRSKIVE